MSGSTSTMLAKMSGVQSTKTRTSSNELTEPMDRPGLKLRPGADIGKKVTEILGASLTQQYSPMD